MMTHAFCAKCSDQKRITSSVTMQNVMVCQLECDHHSCYSVGVGGSLVRVIKWPCWGCDEGVTPETVDPGTGLCPTCAAKMTHDSTERVMTAMGKKAHDIPPPKPPVDLAKVTAAMALAVDHLVGPRDTYDKSINYVTAENGHFEVRESDLCRVISDAPKKVMGASGTMVPGIFLKTPKMPFDILSQTVAFFRGAYAKMNGPTEAFVQVWWNWKDNKYVLHIPEQFVSAASVQHESKFGQGEDAIDWMHVMDMHSHGTMPGFFSGTDDADERRVNGERFSGVIGHVQDKMPDWSFRLITRGQFVPVPVTMIFDLSTVDVPFHVSGEVLMRVVTDRDNLKDGNVRLFCPVDLFATATFPAEWLDCLKNRSYGGGGGHAGFHQGRNLGPMGGASATSQGNGMGQSYRNGTHSRSSGPVPMGHKRYVFIGHDEMEVLSDGNLRKTGNTIRPETEDAGRTS